MVLKEVKRQSRKPNNLNLKKIFLNSSMLTWKWTYDDIDLDDEGMIDVIHPLFKIIKQIFNTYSFADDNKKYT